MASDEEGNCSDDLFESFEERVTVASPCLSPVSEEITNSCSKPRERKAQSSGESDSDNDFENFLSKMRTPAPKKPEIKEKEDDLSNFIVDDSEEDDLEVDPAFYRRMASLDLSDHPENDWEDACSSDSDSAESEDEGEKSVEGESVNDEDAEFLYSIHQQWKKRPSKKDKTDLTDKLFKLFNRRIFASQLPCDMPVIWNAKLTKTAGYCATKSDLSGLKMARIELSVKICDSPERLRDTLCHEMCHAAVWLIDGVRKGGHGPYWKAWTRIVGQQFPQLPLVTRCHSYEITARFVYRCQTCQSEVKRHSKSLDTSKKVCGRCRGRFELLVRKATGELEKASVETGKTPRFAAFVKENYSSVKKAGRSHKDVMGILSEKFKMKLSLD